MSVVETERKLKLTIDEREVGAAPGQTILEAALASGITIPNVCHERRLAPYGGCHMCVVELSRGDHGVVRHVREPRPKRTRALRGSVVSTLHLARLVTPALHRALFRGPLRCTNLCPLNPCVCRWTVGPPGGVHHTGAYV